MTELTNTLGRGSLMLARLARLEPRGGSAGRTAQHFLQDPDPCPSGLRSCASASSILASRYRGPRDQDRRACGSCSVLHEISVGRSASGRSALLLEAPFSGSMNLSFQARRLRDTADCHRRTLVPKASTNDS